MGLREYRRPRTDIDLRNGDTISIRGLAFADIAALVHKYGPVLAMIYMDVMEKAKAKSLGTEDVAHIIQTTLNDTPTLAAEIIALAADEPGAVDQALSLPPVVQMEALYAVVNQTFISEAELKKLVQIVTEAMEQAGGLATMMMSPEPSNDGSGESVEK